MNSENFFCITVGIFLLIAVVANIFAELFLKHSNNKCISTYREREDKFFDFVINNRFLFLVLGALVGVSFLYYFTICLEDDVIHWFSISKESYFISSSKLIILGLPVFILLWFFRTHDTQTQIEKSAEQIKKAEEQIKKAEEQSQKQINQADYFKGLDNLASDDLLKVTIGVRQLVALRKMTKAYDKDISIAFEKLFKLREAKKGIDFTQIDFSGIYLSGAKLSGADLSEADLSEADLSGADLSGADLSVAYLSGADLSGANLSEANLSITNLSEANLSGAKLSAAILTDVNLSGAFYRKKIPPKEIDFEKLGYTVRSETHVVCGETIEIMRIEKK